MYICPSKSPSPSHPLFPLGIQTEISQNEKNKYCVLMYICGIHCIFNQNSQGHCWAEDFSVSRFLAFWHLQIKLFHPLPTSHMIHTCMHTYMHAHTDKMTFTHMCVRAHTRTHTHTGSILRNTSLDTFCCLESLQWRKVLSGWVKGQYNLDSLL